MKTPSQYRRRHRHPRLVEEELLQLSSEDAFDGPLAAVVASYRRRLLALQVAQPLPFIALTTNLIQERSYGRGLVGPPPPTVMGLPPLLSETLGPFSPFVDVDST